MHKVINFFIFIAALQVTSCFIITFEESHARIAEKYAKEKKYKEAIEEYKKHIEERLSLENRPQEENPYLYLLRIGDLFVESGDLIEAERMYVSANEKKVNSELTAERLKLLGRKYTSRNQFDQAYRILKQYQELDPVMFNLELDLTYKSQVEYERKFLGRP